MNLRERGQAAREKLVPIECLGGRGSPEANHGWTGLQSSGVRCCAHVVLSQFGCSSRSDAAISKLQTSQKWNESRRRRR